MAFLLSPIEPGVVGIISAIDPINQRWGSMSALHHGEVFRDSDPLSPGSPSLGLMTPNAAGMRA